MKQEQNSPSKLREIDSATLAETLKRDVPSLLVDVRTAMEFAGGHVPGALNHPLDQLATWSRDLDRETEVFLICRSGNRSGSAAAQLAEAGYSVVNVKGGMMSWRGPVERIATWSRLMIPTLVMLGLGLAPFSPEPHLFEKIRRVAGAAGGAAGMAPLDWFDLVMHGAPVVWFVWSLARLLRDRAAAAS